MIWKEIEELGGRFLVSDTGLVKRQAGNYRDSLGRNKFYPEDIIKPRPGKTGYMRVWLQGKDYYVHRLVAQVFLENVLNKPEVNHKDGNKRNNNKTNLEWATKLENCQHASRLGLINKHSEKRKRQCAINVRKAIEINSKAVLQLDLEGNVIQEYKSVSEAVRAFNGNTNIGAVCRGDKNRKTACGYKWKFKDNS